MPPKKLTVYTTVEDRRKRLKSSVQILFTLTPPADQSKLFSNYPPIAWEVLGFLAGADHQQTIVLHPGVAVSTTKQNQEDIVTSVTSTVIQPRTIACLGDAAGTLLWQDPVPLPIAGDDFEVRNESGRPRILALSTVDTEERFDPLVLLGSVMHGKALRVRPPIMLQAYAVSKHKKGMLLSAENQGSCLFVNWKGEPAPIDITELTASTTFLLYTDARGKFVLEKQE